ncbi:dephospho-CoA kinase [Flavobacterium noncentrifugens]|uniref:Dephospho-CoA kinase n=1 Tax=Flavobacterium noncentrifugens TaxID=1128970 RepID=A0A1G8WCK7_9FLAO|nr:dephospho-CoA kinase [Flavobacterium noncentrifugens]GEP50867.1 dephospho-CoA kinase [Flavobacterium noncentrifugens]SDJ76008.1 dephospho-CoA kinase [Flavobacterium noncentrifugens]
MTKIIGLTGGIGSGKTTVASYFSEFGIPVYIADDEARKLTELPETLAQIRNKIGSEAFNENSLVREKLAAVVFNDPEKLKQLNAIIHPLVKQHFDNWLKNHSNARFVIKETAILFESGSYLDCDVIITVTAPLELRIERVLKRDKTTRENILNRINNQWTDERRISKSDYTIDNTDLTKTKNQAIDLLKKLTIQQN